MENRVKLWVKKDFDATLGVFFDGFSKVIVAIGILMGTMNFSKEFIKTTLFPAIGATVFLFNLYFWYQGRRLQKSDFTKKITALPSGIIVTKMFLWIYGVMLPVYLKTKDPIITWKVAVAANILSGVVFLVFGTLGKKIEKIVPKVAMFGTLAGISIVFLGLPIVVKVLGYGGVGLAVFLIFLYLYFGNYKGKIPQSCILILTGTALAWMAGVMKVDNLILGVKDLGLFLPKLHLDIFLGIKTEIISALPQIVAFSIMDIFTTLMGIEQAKEVDNHFNTNETLLASGALNIVGGILGNPFSCGIYWGHSSWNCVGARTGYSLGVGAIYLLVSTFYLGGVIMGIIPILAVIPFLLFISLKSVEQSFQVIESKYYPAMAVAIIVGVNDMLVSKMGESLKTLPDYIGHFTLSKGSIFLSLIYSSVTYYIIRNEYKKVGGTLLFGAALCSVGLIHSESLGFLLNKSFFFGYLISGIIFYIKEAFNARN